MKWILLAIVLTSVVVADENVLVLTDDTFESALKEHQYLFVKFYAPWCGHCKALAPEYEKAAKIAKDDNKPYVLAEVDATTSPTVASKVGIESYPTLKLYINGEAINFDGERNAEAIISFIEKRIKPPSTKLETLEDIKEVRNKKGRHCILVTEDEEELKNYIDIAKKDEKYHYYHTSPEVAKEIFPEAKKGNVVILRAKDDDPLIYKDKIESDKFDGFLFANRGILISDLDDIMVEVAFGEEGSKSILLFREPEAEGSKDLDEEFKKLAIELKSSGYFFIRIDPKNTYASQIISWYDLDVSKFPILEGLRIKNDTIRYKYTGKFVLNEMKEFVNGIEQGKIPRFFKSEEIPSENPGPVYKVVGKNFKSEVIDNDLDVLVKFYAPWCGHCKKLAPVYKSIAESLTDIKTLKLVEIDASKNDVEGIILEGYPTLLMYSAKSKTKPILYQNSLTEGNIAWFIKQSASHPIDIPELRPKDEGERNKDEL